MYLKFPMYCNVGVFLTMLYLILCDITLHFLECKDPLVFGVEPSNSTPETCMLGDDTRVRGGVGCSRCLLLGI